MIPTISFHTITSIEVAPVRHFPPSATCAQEFWARELIFRGGHGPELGDVEQYTLNLYSYESAAALEIGEATPLPIACLCGYVGPDVEHAPPDAPARLAELARRWGQEDTNDAP